MLLSMGLILAVVALTPLIAPAMWDANQHARRTGDLAKARRLQPWTIAADVMSLLVDLAVAGFVTVLALVGPALIAEKFSAGLSLPVQSGMPAPYAIIAGLWTFQVMSAPLVLVILHHDQIDRASKGDSAAASRRRLLKWAWGFVALLGLFVLPTSTAIVSSGIMP